MTKIYCNVSNNFRKFENVYFQKKNKVFLLFVISTVMIKKNKEESIEILKILGLITNKAEYQKIYNQS